MNKVTGGERTRAPKTANPPSNKVPKEARGFEKRFGKLLPETPAEQEANGRGEGDQPAQGGLVSGSMHRAWTNIKSTITGMNEHPVLAECERGETNGDAIVDNYGETSHNPPDINQPREARGKDEGAMNALNKYLKEIGVTEPVTAEQAARIGAFAKAEVMGRAAQAAAPAARSFAEALEAMTLKDRRAALDQHYAAVKKNTWTKARGGERATPEKFLAWLDVVFPDRREIGMVLSDLQYLDAPAYFKVMNWSDKNSKIEKTVIDSFGLPSKITKYDPVRDANAPKSLAEVVARTERGEGSFKNLNRAFARVQHHVP